MNVRREEVRANLYKSRDNGSGDELLQRVTQQVKSLPEIEAAPNFTAQVMGRVLDKRQRQLFSLPSWVYSFVFLLFLALGFIIAGTLGTHGSLDGSSQSPEEMFLAQTLTESQDLGLLAVQDSSVALLANAGNYGE